MKYRTGTLCWTASSAGWLITATVFDSVGAFVVSVLCGGLAVVWLTMASLWADE